MNHFLKSLRHHQDACERAIQSGKFPAAAHHAARAADYAIQLSTRTGAGPISERYQRDARHWLTLAEKLQKSPAPTGQAPAPEKGGETDPKAQAEGAPSEWLISEKPSITFDKIAGMQEAKDAIREMVLLPLQHLEKARTLGVQAGGGILLYGPPGNGKTLIGKAIANEIDAPFFYASGAQIRSKWHGESEQRLRQLFQAAKAEPVAVLFLDEVDGLLPKRTSGGSVVDTRIVNQFLAEIGGFEDSPNTLLLLGATNKPWDIDDAAFRTGRFDRKLYIPPPDPEAREAILRIHLGDAPTADDLNLADLAKDLHSYTGSDLAGLIAGAKRTALMRSIEDEGEALVSNEDIRKVLPGIYPSANPESLKKFERFSKKYEGNDAD